MIDSLLHDVRYAFRQLRKSPGFTITVALTLAIGIGAATAIFSLIWSVMLKPLPVAYPEQLYKLGSKNGCCNTASGAQNNWSLFSFDLYIYLRDHTRGFESLAAFQSGQDEVSLRREGDPGKPSVSPLRYVSGNYFSTFGVQLLRGRAIQPEDDREGAPPAAVISYRLWHQRFALDPAIVGSTLLINGKAVTVVGVTRPDFHGEKLSSNPPQLWLPLQQESVFTTFVPLVKSPEAHWLDIVGRVPPGTDRRNLEAQINVELKQWLQSRSGLLMPADRAVIGQQHTELAPAGASTNDIRDKYAQGIKLLMYAACAVLLIVCANVASLMLVRSTARKQQTAVCVALGASRSRVVRETLAVSILASLIGGVLALAVAYVTTAMMLSLAFRGEEYVPLDASPSLPVLGFAFAAALLAGALFGAAPAWFNSRSDPADALRGANRGSNRDASSRSQKALVIFQAALSVVLLCTAGLLVRSLQKLEHQNLGFETQGRVIVGIYPPLAGVKRADLDAFYQRLRERLGQIPGVSGVSYALYAPLSFDNWSTWVFLPGQPDPKPNSTWYLASYITAGPDYFKTMGTKIDRGRTITEEDNDHTRHVAVVNETFARRYFQGDALGRRFGIEPELRSQFEIVGVSEDTKFRDLHDPAPPMFFLPIAQTAQVVHEEFKKFEESQHFASNVVLNFRGGGVGKEDAICAALADVNPNLAPLFVHTYDEQLAENLTNDELLARLTSLFGLLALILTAIGLYGVTAYSVQRRTGEIGIRMALGAGRTSVLRNVVGRAMAQVMLGLGIGIALVYPVGKLLGSRVYQVSAFDPVIVLISLLSLSICGGVAALLPARRASYLDPVQALRVE